MGHVHKTETDLLNDMRDWEKMLTASKLQATSVLHWIRFLKDRRSDNGVDVTLSRKLLKFTVVTDDNFQSKSTINKFRTAQQFTIYYYNCRDPGRISRLSTANM